MILYTALVLVLVFALSLGFAFAYAVFGVHDGKAAPQPEPEKPVTLTDAEIHERISMANAQRYRSTLGHHGIQWTDEAQPQPQPQPQPSDYTKGDKE